MISDPNILLSFINTKLRDAYDSLALLCEDLDYDEEEVIKVLEKINYFYDDRVNQFIYKS